MEALRSTGFKDCLSLVMTIIDAFVVVMVVVVVVMMTVRGRSSNREGGEKQCW